MFPMLLTQDPMTRTNPMTRISSNPRSLILLFGLLSLIVLTTACKDEPTSTWAKTEAYPKHKATLTTVETKVGDLFKAFAPLPFEKFDPAQAVVLQKAQQGRMKAFDTQATAVMKTYPEIIGWEASYSYPDVEKIKVTYNFDSFSRAVPSYKASATLRALKFKVEKTKLIGWGMYQIQGKEKESSLGMDVPQYYKGIEVVSTLTQGDAVMTLKTFFVDPELHKEK